MAESIHTVMAEQKFVVNHQGNDLTVELPEWLDITDITDLDHVEAWLASKSPEERLGFYHYGFDSSIIKARAATRPQIKTFAKLEDFEAAVKGLDDPTEWHVSRSKQTITRNILDDLGALERCRTWVPKPKAVPGSGGSKTFAKGEEAALQMAIEALKLAAMTDGVIVDILGEKFDRTKVQMVLEGLNS